MARLKVRACTRWLTALLADIRDEIGLDIAVVEIGVDIAAAHRGALPPTELAMGPQGATQACS